MTSIFYIMLLGHPSPSVIRPMPLVVEFTPPAQNDLAKAPLIFGAR